MRVLSSYCAGARRTAVARGSFALAALVLLGACSRRAGDTDPGDRGAAAPNGVGVTRARVPDTLSAPGDVPLEPGMITVAHPERVRLAAVEVRAAPDRLRGTCAVSPDVNRTVPVNALGSGRVLELRASLGDRVKKGQPLVVISSPDLASALGDYHKLQADAELARQQLERSRLLFAHGTVARKDLESAENAAHKADVDLRTSRERIRLLGGEVGQSAPSIVLRAPIAGTIVEQNVTTAAGVKSPDNAPNLFTIADLSHVWVLCDVYENELARVRVGALARVRLSAYPERTFQGQITNVSAVLDSASRTAKARVELENPDGIMRKGMFATAELVSRTSVSRLAVPTTAILRLHDADWVFVRTGARSFRRTQVRTGQDVGEGFQEVTAGLAAGDQVVRDALQFSQSGGGE